MDNFDLVNFNEKDLKKPAATEEDKSIPFSFDDTAGSAEVSRPPINLGGGATVKPAPAPMPAVLPPAAPKPAVGTIPARPVSGSERITTVKNFFTKLHPGALEFLDQQISQWLKDNPGIRIKFSNTVTGVVQGKKDEPHIIITIWY